MGGGETEEPRIDPKVSLGSYKVEVLDPLPSIRYWYWVPMWVGTKFWWGTFSSHKGLVELIRHELRTLEVSTSSTRTSGNNNKLQFFIFFRSREETGFVWDGAQSWQRRRQFRVIYEVSSRSVNRSWRIIRNIKVWRKVSPYKKKEQETQPYLFYRFLLFLVLGDHSCETFPYIYRVSSERSMDPFLWRTDRQTPPLHPQRIDPGHRRRRPVPVPHDSGPRPSLRN